MMLGEPIKEGDKYGYFRCYKCKTILFAVHAHKTGEPVPFWLVKKIKVRKTWELAKIEEEVYIEK